MIVTKTAIPEESLTKMIKSYSPSINQKLEQFKNSFSIKNQKVNSRPFDTQRSQLFDCLQENALISLDTNDKQDPKYIFLYDKSMPKIYVNGSCFTHNNMKVQKILLKALNESVKKIDVSKVITPKQYASNCWFNTFFVMFFVSDKGRKFSKALRHFMITQKGVGSSKKIDSMKMRKTLIALNLAIEASLTGHPMAYKINTNSFILSIANSMPPKYKRKMPRIGEPSNPTTFYNSLLRYFENEFGIKNIKVESLRFLNKRNTFDNISDKILNSGIDLIFVNIYDVGDNNANISNQLKKTMKLTNSSNTKEYTLGGAVIRDTKQLHFCCVCNVNGKEYGFDGASFKLLNPFNWSKLLNVDQEWTFEGSIWTSGNNMGKPIFWNFMNGYQILFYYRTK